MKLHVAIVVWGAWHIDMLERATLPSILSAGNLPLLAQRHATKITIYTCRPDMARLRSIPAVLALGALAPVTFEAVSEDAAPPPELHQESWRKCLTDSRRDGYKVLIVHPDVVWADGALSRIAEPLDQGKYASLMPPNLRVVSETFVPDIEQLYGKVMAIPPRELVGLAMHHIHPLTALTRVGSDPWVPAPERTWPVPGNGLVMRAGYQPVIACDPNLCQLNIKGFATDIGDLTHFHTVDTEADGLFVSLAPLAKDCGLILPEGGGRPLDLGRWSTISEVDVPNSGAIARRAMTLAYADGAASVWRNAKRRSDAFMARADTWRRITRIWAELRDRGHTELRKIFALAMQNLDLVRLVHGAGPFTLALPSDYALWAFPRADRNRILAIENTWEFTRIARAHIFAGTVTPSALTKQTGAKITASFRVDDTTILIVDRVLGYD